MRRRITILAALVLWASMIGSAAAIGDLVPEVYQASVVRGNVGPGDVAEGCAGGEINRLLLRYAMRTRNVGHGDVVLGNPGCPDCRANPGAACTNPYFLCSTAHGHAHFEGFAVADLLTASGEPIIQGRKYGFCLLDTECSPRVYTCQNQGISAGCADVYGLSTSCQYIDLTDIDLRTGSYRLRVEVDPEDKIPEADKSNNTFELPLELTCANSPDGMRCDDGETCTVGERCQGDDCVAPATTPTSTRVKMRLSGVEDRDRFVLTARFDSGWLAEAPSESGVELTLIKDGTVVYSAFAPPAGFEDLGGGDYLFRDRDGEFEEASGLSRMRVHIADAKHRVIVRAIASGLNLPEEARSTVLHLTQSYGSGPSAVCLSNTRLDCAGSASTRSCKAK